MTMIFQLFMNTKTHLTQKNQQLLLKILEILYFLNKINHYQLIKKKENPL